MKRMQADDVEKYVVRRNASELVVHSLSFADAGAYVSLSSSAGTSLTQLTVVGQSLNLLR